MTTQISPSVEHKAPPAPPSYYNGPRGRVPFYSKESQTQFDEMSARLNAYIQKKKWWPQTSDSVPEGKKLYIWMRKGYSGSNEAWVYRYILSAENRKLFPGYESTLEMELISQTIDETAKSLNASILARDKKLVDDIYERSPSSLSQYRPAYQ